jgi:hypothetical protein
MAGYRSRKEPGKASPTSGEVERETMKIEEIAVKDIPEELRAYRENIAIYGAAKKLLQLGPGRAMKVCIIGANQYHIAKKAHVYFRRKPFRLRTRTYGDFMYLWIEERPATFQITAIPLKKPQGKPTSIGWEHISSGRSNT